jgi:hypothetical protein
MKRISLALLLAFLLPTMGFSQLYQKEKVTLYQKKMATFQEDEKQNETSRSSVGIFRADEHESDEGGGDPDKIEPSPEPLGDCLPIFCLFIGLYAVFIRYGITNRHTFLRKTNYRKI